MTAVSVVPSFARSPRMRVVTRSVAVRTSAAPVRPAPLPTVDIVLPAHDEAQCLEQSVRALHGVLQQQRGFRARIVIAENGSTDATAEIAARLTRALRGVMLLRLAEAGRGRALRAAWLQSTADVVAYMDVDLSTDLAALPALIEAVTTGNADVVTGSRLLRGSCVQRSVRRTLISRAYNLLVRRKLRLRTHDAQCGFKALRGDVARRLVPRVADDGWFFDTELLYRAQREHMLVREIPVRWVEDTTSTVHILRTALHDLRGVSRLRSETHADGGALRRGLKPEIARFCAVGAVSTVAYLALFAVLSRSIGDAAGNALALGVTAVANTAANRRFTWRVSGAAGRLCAQLGGVTTFVLALACSTGSLGLLHLADGGASEAAELAVLLGVTVMSTAVRFLLLRVCIVGLAPATR